MLIKRNRFYETRLETRRHGALFITANWIIAFGSYARWYA